MTEVSLTTEEVKKLLEALQYLPLSSVRENLERKLVVQLELLKVFPNDYSSTRVR